MASRAAASISQGMAESGCSAAPFESARPSPIDEAKPSPIDEAPGSASAPNGFFDPSVHTRSGLSIHRRGFGASASILAFGVSGGQ